MVILSYDVTLPDDEYQALWRLLDEQGAIRVNKSVRIAAGTNVKWWTHALDQHLHHANDRFFVGLLDVVAAQGIRNAIDGTDKVRSAIDNERP